VPAEDDINLMTATLRQAQSAIIFYADPAWIPSGWRLLADTSREQLANAEPGSGFQLMWARMYATAAVEESDLRVLGGWLDGIGVPDGLTLAADLRWAVLQSLVARGVLGPDEIEAELNADRTASGERQAALARALVPTPEAKAETWRRLVADHQLPNWLQRAMLSGFQHPDHVELTRPYVAPYFAALAEIWATLDSEPAQDFVELAYPAYQVSQDVVDASNAWLAEPDHPAPLRRLVAEGRDGGVRALRARVKDSTSAW
jgi:aminopeptidase N